jgi:hypothetical protein
MYLMRYILLAKCNHNTHVIKATSFVKGRVNIVGAKELSSRRYHWLAEQAKIGEDFNFL